MTTDADVKFFLKYLRRRMALQSAVDRIAGLVFVAAITAIILFPFAIWGPLLPPAVLIGISIITIGAAIILLFCRWPTLADAADVADRQLGLDDLLATALRLRPVPFDDLSAVVLAVARARCDEVHSSQIAIHRLSPKSWVGVLLAVAVAITLAVLPERSANAPREKPAANVLADSVDSTSDPDLRRSTADNHSSRSDPVGEGKSAMTVPMDSTGTAKTSPSSAADQPSAPSGGAASTGRGSASTNHQATVSPLQTAVGNHASDPSGNTAGGSGQESTAQATGTDNTTGTSGPSLTTPTVPPWQSDGWPAARAAAISAVHSGTIPPGCRDLVRDYFQ